MINFENFDKKIKYLGLQYGMNSFIAKQIRKYSKCYCPDAREVPTHVLAFSYENSDWWVYESHAKGNKKLGIPAGVRRYKAKKWLELEADNLKEFKAYPLDIDLNKLEEYIGYPYGLGDIKALLMAALKHNNGKQKNRNGYICSEYIALCYPKICEFYKLPAHCITPAHFQDYLDKYNIEAVGV
jgi:hypothetical protein